MASSAGPLRRIQHLGSINAVAAARLVSAVSAAVQLPILTRSLPPAEFALVAALMAVATYVSLFSGDPTTLAFQRFPGTRRALTNYYFAAWRIAAAFALVGLAAGVALGLVVSRAFALGVVGWALGLAVARFTSTAWLMWGEPWRYSTNLMASTLVRTCVLLALVMNGFDALLALGAAGVASAAVALALSPRVRSARGVARPWRLSMGLVLALGSLGSTIIVSADKLIVPSVATLDDAGRYGALYQAVALTVGAALSIMGTALFPAVLARWDRGDVTSAVGVVRRTLALCVVAAALTFAALALIGEWLIERVLGAEYVDMQMAFLIAAAACVYQLGQQASWHHRLTTRVATLGAASMIGALVTVLATYGFGSVAGIYGACAGVLVGTSIYAVVMARGSGHLAYASLGVLGVGSTACLFAFADVYWLGFIAAALLLSSVVFMGRRPARSRTVGD